MNKTKCGCIHEYCSTIKSRTKKTGCPYCCKPKRKFCIHESFEALYPDLAKEWHPTKNGGLKPSLVSYGSTIKVWWLGNSEYCNHEFYCAIKKRTRGSGKSGCNICVNKSEKILFEFLKENNFDVIKNFHIGWCKNKETNKFLPFDFVIEKYKIIIELDGYQHFNDIKKWNAYHKDIQERDIYKMKCANNNNYSVIRIKQNDVYGNKNEWNNKLINNIKIYSQIRNIFISADDSYKDYIQNFDDINCINIS